MSSTVSLNFLQELRALELEMSTFITAVSTDTEDSPELFSILVSSMRSRLDTLVQSAVEFILIGNTTQLSSGEGDEEQTTNGLPVVTELLINALLTSILRVAAAQSDNLSVTKDILTTLNTERSVPNSEKVLPSLTAELSNLLVLMVKMKESFMENQPPEELENNIVESSVPEDGSA